MSPVRAPMTLEQLAFFTDQTDRAVRKALRRYATGAILGFAVLAGGIGCAMFTSDHDSDRARDAIVRSGTIVAVDSCNRDFHFQQAFFTSLLKAVDAQVAKGDATTAQGEFAKNFYRDELRKLPDCRKAEKILTDDPDVHRNPPAPRFPGDGKG